MSEKKVRNRWFVAVGALLIQLALGAIYAWSVFTPSLIDAGWSKVQTQIVFSAGLFFFAVVMVIAGRLMPKVGPRKLAITGGIILGAGYILGGIIAPVNFWSLLIFIGLIGGSGIGLAYVVPIAVGMQWFPDKKGMITGIAVAGFGFGAMLWIKGAGSWGNMLSSYGIGTTFIVYGIAFFIMTAIGGFFMVYPPEGWKPEGWSVTGSDKKNAASAVQADFQSKEMLKTSQYWMIFITFLFAASAGLMSIGLMKLFPMKALMANGVNAEAAAVIAGTAMAVFFSIANGIGRIGWGVLSDKIGSKLSLIIMIGVQGLLVLLFPYMAGNKVLLYIWASLIGLNFGGNFSLFPTITAETFGAKNVGQNYGWVFLSYGVGGILGPIMGGKLGDMNNFPLAFTIAGVLCLIAAVVIAFVKPPVKTLNRV